MLRFVSLAIILGISWTSAGSAQAIVCKFQWKPGQVLIYKAEQATTASETVENKKSDSSSKVTTIKRWEVLDVDNAGVATLQLSLTTLRVETTTAKGEVLVFDSADPAKSDTQLREQLGKLVGKQLAVLRVNTQGKVLEVKKSDHGPASRFEAEPPFVVVVPGEQIQPDERWQRNYNITLEPPQGTGEKHPATQIYQYKPQGDKAAIYVKTAVKKMPDSVVDQIPLMQMQPEGGAIFDVKAGRVERAVLEIEGNLKGHQGEGSTYHFHSRYQEQYVGDR